LKSAKKDCMKKTIYLEAFLDKDFLKIGIHKPDRPIRTYEEIAISADRIGQHCRKITEILNRNSRKASETSDAAECLNEYGRMLCDDLLTPGIKDALETNDADYLIFSLDDHLVHVPWELICIGDTFLCRRFSTGRYVRTRQKISGNRNRNLTKPLKLWIIANPEGNLPGAGSEGMNLFRYANQNQALTDASLDADIRADRIRLRIKDYDIVHFAGHAEYFSRHDPGGTGASGWKLTDGYFKAEDIYKMAGGAAMPSLIFSNACQSARTEAWESEEEQDGSFGLANAFLFAGVSHYIGTFWEIRDQSGSDFALEFYRHIFSGKSVGESVKESRQALAEKYGQDSVSWAPYLLYGDPGFSYFGSDEALETPESGDAVIPLPLNDKRNRGGSESSAQLSEFTGQQVRERKNPKFFLTALLVSFMLMFGGFLSWNALSVYFQIHTANIMQETARRKQEQILILMEKIEKKMPQPESSDSKTGSGELTMAVTYDPVKSAYSQGKEGIISSALIQEIKSRCPHIRIAERREFNLILEELNIALSSLTGAENRLHPNLLNAKLMLLIETDRSFFQSFVLMRLFDTESGEVIFSSVEKLKTGRTASQNISENLLKALRHSVITPQGHVGDMPAPRPNNPLYIQPLRERKEDIPELAACFIIQCTGARDRILEYFGNGQCFI